MRLSPLGSAIVTSRGGSANVASRGGGERPDLLVPIIRNVVEPQQSADAEPYSLWLCHGDAEPPGARHGARLSVRYHPPPCQQGDHRPCFVDFVGFIACQQADHRPWRRPFRHDRSPAFVAMATVALATSAVGVRLPTATHSPQTPLSHTLPEAARCCARTLCLACAPPRRSPRYTAARRPTARDGALCCGDPDRR